MDKQQPKASKVGEASKGKRGEKRGAIDSDVDSSVIAGNILTVHM